MNVPILVISIGGVRAGVLFKYAPENIPVTQRFQTDEAYAALPFDEAPVLSESMRADEPEQQRAFWLDITSETFNGEVGSKGESLLPSWFQNLLPEGIFRRYVAEEAKIAPDDFFSLLAACGKDLPGNVTAVWEDVGRDTLASLITQRNDSLEFSVWAEPFQDAISISGIQPKLGVNKTSDGRFVGRTKMGDTAIIAKLPAPDYPRMPEVEYLSMSLARASGISTCDFSLEPMSALSAPHRYDLGEEAQGKFLAIYRFDRIPNGRVHMEDFAQVLGVQPDNKYSESYIDIAATLMDLPGCGEGAVIELIRRIAFNDLIGNADMHLKNAALIYPDGKSAQLSPAYDIVAQALYHPIKGHALSLMGDLTKRHDPREPVWTPQRLRAFCAALGMQEVHARNAVKLVYHGALTAGLDLIPASGMTPRQKSALLHRIYEHPHSVSTMKRDASLKAQWDKVLADHPVPSKQ